MISRNIQVLINKYSSIYQVEPHWVAAIILTESNGNPNAIRYESGYPYMFETEKFSKKIGCTLATEINCQKMSWGLGQIMGGLAREQGHDGWLTELLDPDLNVKHICIRLEYLKKKATIPNDIFAGYNGGPGLMKLSFDHKYVNQVYVDKVNQNLKLV